MRGLKRPPRGGRYAGFFDFVSALEELFAGFDGARAGDEGDFFAASGAAEFSAEGDDGAVFFDFARGHFVLGEDGHDFFDAGGVFDIFLGLVAVVAEGGDDGAFGALDDVLAKAELADEAGDVIDLGVGGALFHDDDHWVLLEGWGLGRGQGGWPVWFERESLAFQAGFKTCGINAKGDSWISVARRGRGLRGRVSWRVDSSSASMCWSFRSGGLSADKEKALDF